MATHGSFPVLKLAQALALVLVLSPALAGATTQGGSLAHDGRTRSYLLHVPANHDKNDSVPLVIALHGGLGSGKRMVELTGGRFNALAERERFVVVYPDGVDRHWNDGRSSVNYRAHKENVDDVGFLTALIDRLARDWNIDRRRVYVTGVSNGAMMAFRLACERADRIAAFAPVAGSLVVELAGRCAPARPVPMLMISNTDDKLVPWNGGDVRYGRRKLGRIISVPETARRWSALNGCSADPVVTRAPDRDPQDGTRLRRETYRDCRDGAAVVLLAVEGGGHTWPGGTSYLGERRVGRVSREIDASDAIWEFFRPFALR